MKSDLFLGGQWISSTEKMKVLNPFDETVITTISLAGEEHIERAIALAIQAKKAYTSLSTGDISVILMQITRGLEARAEEFANLIVLESGKPYRYASGEVQRGIETFRVAAEECKRIPGEILALDWTEQGRGKKGRVEYKSAGIIAGISPFNFPLNLVAHKIAPAIATGSPILLKPSSSTPLTALLLADIIAHTNLPEGALSVLPCSRVTGQKLVEDTRINVLSFTGSPDVGWKMKSQAGKKKVVLELGGNAAAIVHKDADIAATVQKLIVGGYAYSGQVCIHTQRIFIHKDKYAEFRELYCQEVEKLRVGDPSDKDTRYSVMIDEKNARRVENWLKEAEESGAKIICGGERKGALIAPTLLESAAKGMKVWDEEVFGPVVCLDTYSTLDEVIKKMNDSRFGLQASVFSKDHEVLETCYECLEVGGMIVNESTTFRVDQMPYGGVKDSGFGREGVKYAMMDYLEPKLMVF